MESWVFLFLVFLVVAFVAYLQLAGRKRKRAARSGKATARKPRARAKKKKHKR